MCRDCLRPDGIMGQSWFHSGGRETRRLSPRSFTSSLQPHLELPYGGTSRGVQRAGSKLLLQSITALCFPPEFWGLPVNLQTISRKKRKSFTGSSFFFPQVIRQVCLKRWLALRCNPASLIEYFLNQLNYFIYPSGKEPTENEEMGGNVFCFFSFTGCWAKEQQFVESYIIIIM